MEKEPMLSLCDNDLQDKNYELIMTSAKSWKSIESHYTDGVRSGRKLEPLLELVQLINASSLSTRLYAFTSVDKLIISIYPDIKLDREALHIVFDYYKQKWEFKYFAKSYQKPEFVRYYPAEAVLEKFEQFISMIRW
ncbi:hypothetical protein [Hymenobacter canadensis]|uniref:Uncharacterized protein n=1 Tax=Hymenobacter canadensis TaxID=2999067 RepID=A0ABY7LSF5_9BACT|nr:hypothetical protein [Hymenobacter canadensis]WBA43352.1 hypothetical protein O3303_07235 [Hymenobacter canadensis]